jgi:hypothetical protein
LRSLSVGRSQRFAASRTACQLRFLRNRTATRTSASCNLPALSIQDAPGWPRVPGVRSRWGRRVRRGIRGCTVGRWWLLLGRLRARAPSPHTSLCVHRPVHPLLFPLTSILAPVVLVGAVVAAIARSTLLSVLLENRLGAPPTGPSEPRREMRVRAPKGPIFRPPWSARLPRPAPTASPFASPGASPPLHPPPRLQLRRGPRCPLDGNANAPRSQRMALRLFFTLIH